ncbi:MAG: DUF488 family protein, partial [Planctomycetes bacterium]|nr:DUF488 family protein [Planctomycetota bacterium]
PARTDGCRVLVDRLWPRGVAKAEAKVDVWAKELAPSDELRRWFGHDPERWTAFRQRYRRELDDRQAAVTDLVESCPGRTLTLLYAARDETHNNAAVLKAFIEQEILAAAGRT